MSERDLERALVDLGHHLRFPEAPDLSGAVGQGISNVRPLPRRPRRRRAVLLTAATLLLLVGGLAAFVPGVRATLVRIITLGAVRIEVGVPRPSPPPPLTGELELGRRVSLEEAEDAVPFPIRMPTVLGAPDAVFVDDLPLGEIVWLAYEERPGLSANDETGLGALVAVFEGRPEGDFLLGKLPPAGVNVERVMVDGHEGYWLSGPPHDLFFIGPNGEVIDDRTRLAGNTLLWEVDGVTYRVESALGRDEAIALAETFA